MALDPGSGQPPDRGYTTVTKYDSAGRVLLKAVNGQPPQQTGRVEPALAPVARAVRPELNVELEQLSCDAAPPDTGAGLDECVPCGPLKNPVLQGFVVQETTSGRIYRCSGCTFTFHKNKQVPATAHQAALTVLAYRHEELTT